MSNRFTHLLAVVALAAIPAAASAQAVVPAAAATGAPTMVSKVKTKPTLRAPAFRAPRPDAAPRILPAPALSERLAAATPEDTPEVELRAKAWWFDDQGLRMDRGKIAYRQRF